MLTSIPTDSPSTDTNDGSGYVWFARSSGVLDNDGVSYVSYGHLTRYFIPNFIQKYWWLRSPSRRSTDNTFFVYDDGNVSSDIWIVVDSYGINMPYMTDDDAFLIEPYGIIHNDYDISQIHNSYGFL